MAIQLQIHMESSAYLECCGFLGDSGQTLRESFSSLLTSDEIVFVEQLKHDKGVGLAEFFVHAEKKSYDDILAFMENLDINHFYYYFKNEDMSLEEVKLVPNFKKSAIKQMALSVLKKCYPHAVGHFEEGDYEHSYLVAFERLKVLSPLELGQEMMGKRFFRVSDYKAYYFVPVANLKRPAYRVFSDQVLVIVYPLVEKQEELSTEVLSEALRVIADPTRLQIMELLKGKAMYGKEIADVLGIKAATITHHIEQLNKINLLHTDKSGQIKYFSLNKKIYAELLKQLNRFMA